MKDIEALLIAAEAAGLDAKTIERARNAMHQAHAVIRPFAVAAQSPCVKPKQVVLSTPSKVAPNFYLTSEDLYRAAEFYGRIETLPPSSKAGVQHDTPIQMTRRGDFYEIRGAEAPIAAGILGILGIELHFTSLGDIVAIPFERVRDATRKLEEAGYYVMVG